MAKLSKEELKRWVRVHSAGWEPDKGTLEEWIEHCKVSINEISQVLGVSRGILYRWISGIHGPSDAAKILIADLSLRKVTQYKTPEN